MSKIFSPSDFPVQPASQFRQELIDALSDQFSKGNWFRADNVINVRIRPVRRYSQENLIDFCDHYSKAGKWKSVTCTRTKQPAADNQDIDFHLS